MRSTRALLCGIWCVTACTSARPDVAHTSAAVAALPAPLVPQAPLVPLAAPLAPLALADLGPAMATTPGGLYPWTGRVMSGAVNPSNDQIALVASDRGGLWRTADGGTTWTHVDGLPVY